MKTYTIRPLEWEYTDGGGYLADGWGGVLRVCGNDKSWRFLTPLGNVAYARSKAGAMKIAQRWHDARLGQALVEVGT